VDWEFSRSFHLVGKIKVKKFVFLATAFLLSIAPSAAFAESTQLTWERSQMQQVEVDPNLASQITTLSLIGQGEELQFTAASTLTDTGRTLYQVLIPSSFDLGSYVVHAAFNDGTFKDLAVIRVVEFQSESYNPLTDTKTVTTLSVTLFSLLAAWGISDSEMGRRKEYEDDQTTFDGADGGAIGRAAHDAREFRKGLVSSIYLDQIRSSWTILTNRFSPLLSRLISDGGYLQFSLGILSLVFPIIGGLLGGLAFKDIEGNGGITTPSFAIVAAILVVGALDAGAGFVASVIFGFCALTSHRFGNVYDIRTYLGLAILFFAPSFIANATRTLRRSRKDEDRWERLTDVVVGSIITGWAIRCMVAALDGFAHLRLPLHQYAGELGVIAGIAVALRYLIEEFVNRKNHYYLAYLSPRSLNELNPNLRIVGWFVKGILFIFFAVSFLGITWQLWTALTLLMIPQLVKAIKEKLPNSPILFQILPVGVPALVVMIAVGHFYASFINSLDLEPASASRTVFLLAAIPGFIITLLKFFGRSPIEGDVRWYRRANMKNIYRLGGTALFVTYSAITFGLVGF
jgi:hypothetical protein